MFSRFNLNSILFIFKPTESCVNHLFHEASLTHPGMACVVIGSYYVPLKARHIWHFSESKCGIFTSRTAICATKHINGWVYNRGEDTPDSLKYDERDFSKIGHLLHLKSSCSAQRSCTASTTNQSHY
ncbi:hypothetical protein DSO57_1027028 [Entomophthora muscae]|uniref:Uncharacterized protein n=1 Tax=Entomophthora muscae TaxID=34485 RepID=A0ACC2TCS5_9FUNG|nr:hypothetical protein DSO57_1027028 [Entomophthora muscae]